MSAIFLHSERPPAAQVSGWMMSMARVASTSRKPTRVNLAFAARDRDRERRLDRPVACQVLGRHRLLEPADVQLLDGAAELDRGDRVIGVVRVHHQADVGADGLADGARGGGVLGHPEPTFSFTARKPSAA